MQASNRYRICLTFVIIGLMVLCGCEQNEEWYTESMNYAELQKIESSKERIAFIDTGIADEIINDYNVIGTLNTFDNSDDVTDDNGHGTAVLSAACGNDENDIPGICPDVELIIIKAADKNGAMNFENLLEGLDFAKEKNATIVNISLGGYQSDDDVKNKLIELYNDNITVVAATGDYSQRDILFPANVNPYVISVAAIDSSGRLWEESNRNDCLMCAFPGEKIKVLTIDNGEIGTIYVDGTSEATAIASAYIAKLRSVFQLKNRSKVNLNEKKKYNHLTHYLISMWITYSRSIEFQLFN